MKNRVNDNILSFIDKSPDLLMSDITPRVKQRRLEKDWTQKMLAAKPTNGLKGCGNFRQPTTFCQVTDLMVTILRP